MPAVGGGGAPAAGAVAGADAGAEDGAEDGDGPGADATLTAGEVLVAGRLGAWGIGAAATAGGASGRIPASPLSPAKPPKNPTLAAGRTRASGAITCNCGKVLKTS